MFDFFDLFQPKDNNKKGSHEKIKNPKREKALNDAKDEVSEQKKSFSKVLLVQESLLIWIHTLAMLTLAYICVFKGAYAELPWLTAMVSLPWAAYAVSQHAYYKKSVQENTVGGIVFETAMAPYSETEDCR